MITTISTAMTARLKTNKLESINVSTTLATIEITQSLKLPTNKNSTAETKIATNTKPKGLKSPLSSKDFFLSDSLLLFRVIFAIYFEFITLSRCAIISS